jgi:hypothetical protein
LLAATFFKEARPAASLFLLFNKAADCLRWLPELASVCEKWGIPARSGRLSRHRRWLERPLDWVAVSVAPRAAGGQNQIVVHPAGAICSDRLVKNTLPKISSATPL